MSRLVRIIALASIAVAVLAFLDSCKRSGSPDVVHVLASSDNSKFGLSVQFYGREMKLDDGRQVKLVEYLSVKDTKNGKEVRYTPIDASSLSSSEGFFTHVWSPDESLLILPLGRFEGFSVMKSSEVMTRLANSSFNDTFRVQLTSGARLWHEFNGWASADEFDFSAGLSGQTVPFRYTASSHTIAPREAVSGNYVAVTSQGETPIKSATATKK